MLDNLSSFFSFARYLLRLMRLLCFYGVYRTSITISTRSSFVVRPLPVTIITMTVIIIAVAMPIASVPIPVIVVKRLETTAAQRHRRRFHVEFQLYALIKHDL